MKIYIIGTGGVGGYFGGMLARAGEDVTFVARGQHFEAIKSRGLQVQTVEGNFTISPAQVIPTISEIRDPDLILVTCKSYDLMQVIEELNGLTKSETVLLTCQNGIDSDLTTKKWLKRGHVYPAIIHIVSAIAAPGVIAQTGGLRRITFGERGEPASQTLKAIETMMTGAGIRAVASDDIIRDLWLKYVLILPWAGTTSYFRLPVDQILNDPDKRKMYEQALQEALAVAAAEGVALPSYTFEKTIALSDKTTPGSKSSMLVDIENGRRTEIETLHGTLISLAQKHGTAVPTNQKIYDTVRAVRTS